MQRPDFIDQIQHYFQIHPIVALLGPRQSGKTTLANMFLSIKSDFSHSNHFDLENPLDVERLKNPVLTLMPLKGLIIIEEIQRIPQLFPALRYITDSFKEEKNF